MVYDYEPTYPDMMLDPRYLGVGYLIYGLERYVKAHVCPSNPFLRAVLANDLFAVYKMAEARDLEALPALVRFIVNVVPAEAYGSDQRVKDWISSPCGDGQT